MRRFPVIVLAIVAACSSSSDRAVPAKTDTLVVFTAASLSAPMRVALDTFAARNHVVLQEEHGASLELARRITALGRIPDLVALADQEVFPEQLMPGATSWYAAFARNRMVVAYTDRSRHASEMTAATWREILQRSDVSVGRSDPTIAPVGYRALLTYALAERFYHDVGLAKRLESKTPPAHIRGSATELAALLQAGEIDYIVDYESLAKAQGLRYVTLPSEIDLGDAARAADYALASVRVVRMKDTVTRKGAPILYGLSIPRAAAHRAAVERFLEFLLSTEGTSLLRQHAIDALDHPVVLGDSAPPSLASYR